MTVPQPVPQPVRVVIDDAVMANAVSQAVTRWLTVNNAVVTATIHNAVDSSITHWLEEQKEAHVHKHDPIRVAVMRAVKQWLSINRKSWSVDCLNSHSRKTAMTQRDVTRRSTRGTVQILDDHGRWTHSPGHLSPPGRGA